MTLEKRSFRVIEASNGLQALRRLDENPEVGLVLTDVEMPVMNGLELVRSLRRDGRHPGLPVVVQTSEPDAVEPADRAALGILLVLEKGAFWNWLRTLSDLPATSKARGFDSSGTPVRRVELFERAVEVRVRHGSRPRVVHLSLLATEVPPEGSWCFRVSFDPKRLLFVLAEDGAEATPHGAANRDGVLLTCMP